MTQKDLKIIVAETIGAQNESNDLVLRILTKKIANQLQPGEAVRIKNVGTFSKPKVESEYASESIAPADKLVFMPITEASGSGTETLFTSIPVVSKSDSNDFSAERYFEIGGPKPHTSIFNSAAAEGDVLSLKEIDNRLEDLLSSSEKIEDYNIWSKSTTDAPDETTSGDENIFNDTEPDNVSESETEESLLGISSIDATDREFDDSLELPDFESMENDFISEIQSPSSDEKIDIVSEDDIIIPGEIKKTDEDDRINELENDADAKIDEEIKNFQSNVDEDDTDEEETLDEIFNEFQTGHKDEELEDIAALPLDHNFDDPNIEESDSELDALTPSGVEGNTTDEKQTDDELDEVALENEDAVDSEDLLGIGESKIEESSDDEDSTEKNILFDEPELENEKDENEEVGGFVDEPVKTEESLSEPNEELKNLDEDFDITGKDYEIEHLDFDKEGIETVSASIEELVDSNIAPDEIDPDEHESETEAKPPENKIDDKFEDSIDDDFVEHEDPIADVANELPHTDEKHLETKMDENEYSKLSPDSDQSKAALGKGFWISVMIFVVVVVVGAYLYLFVYDTEDKGTVAENGKVNEQTAADVETPPAVSDSEQQPAEPVEQAIPQKREVVRIQGTGEKSFYRDGAGERLVANTIFEKDGLYSVQVSSFKTQDVAESDARRIQKLGHEAFIVKAFVPKLNAEYFRVRVGYFNTQKEAEEFSKSFKQ